jgi:hypothetical protein
LLPIREDVRRTIERSELAHAVLVEIIKKINSELGDCFANLRKRRNNADYNTKIEIKPKDAVWALKSADKIIKEIQARVGEIGESDIITAWEKVQRSRDQKNREDKNFENSERDYIITNYIIPLGVTCLGENCQPE